MKGKPKMNETTDGYIYFYIDGDTLDPDMCTAHIGITPTSKHRKGDVIAEGWRFRRRTGSWQVELKNKELREINTDTEALLDILLPAKSTIHTILQNKEIVAGIFCVVCVYDEKPCLKLSAECLRKLSELGVDYEIDYYDYTKCDEQDDEPTKGNET